MLSLASNILLNDGKVVLCDFGSAVAVEHATEERSAEQWPIIGAGTRELGAFVFTYVASCCDGSKGAM
jgi:serine/threonine protein kinase